ncbi:SdpI family protein [Corynebacterium sp. L4756]|uniref:SdpI family protein n=1 Tax=unclassified Corynebacterium TaxID=2624378 RepID=UPI00374D3C64
MVAVGIIFLIISLYWLVFGGLATARRLPGNKYFGLRIPDVRRSKEAWDGSHVVAGPVWILAGVAFLFGGLAAFRASGWLWLIPVATAIIGFIAISVGSNLGARAAHLYTLKAREEDSGCISEGGCNCGSGGCGSAGDTPQVDMEALRDAVKNVDNPK